MFDKGSPFGQIKTPDPLDWDTSGLIQDNVARVQGFVASYSKLLRDKGIEQPIDEAAILVRPGAEDAHLFTQLRMGGWEFFNESSDQVLTGPFNTVYRVSYRFYQHPDYPWRIEVMKLGSFGGSNSPLHRALLQMRHEKPGWRFPMPHLSFKVPDMSEYAKTLDKLRDGLGDGLIHAQTCQSAYGAFSYWIPCSAERQLYVKPRVNLRDAEAGPEFVGGAARV